MGSEITTTKTLDEMLDEKIRASMIRIDSLEAGSAERSEAVSELEKLYKIRTENVKATSERTDQKRALIANAITAGAELILPLIFYGVWMRRGLKFEETGTFTSQTFKWLASRFKPTKR